MATEEKKELNIEQEAQQNENNSQELATTNEKKGFWKSLGIGAKIGIGILGTGLLAGAGWLIKSLLIGDDDDAETESTTTEE